MVIVPLVIWVEDLRTVKMTYRRSKFKKNVWELIQETEQPCLEQVWQNWQIKIINSIKKKIICAKFAIEPLKYPHWSHISFAMLTLSKFLNFDAIISQCRRINEQNAFFAKFATQKLGPVCYKGSMVFFS